MDKLGVAVGQVNHQIYFPIPYQPEETMPKIASQCILTKICDEYKVMQVNNIENFHLHLVFDVKSYTLRRKGWGVEVLS